MTSMAGKSKQIVFERTIKIRIYVYPVDEGWIAESVQLVQMGSGRTPEEAINGLLEAIHVYAETVMARKWFDQFDRKLGVRRRLGLWFKVKAAKLRFRPAMSMTRAVQF